MRIDNPKENNKCLNIKSKRKKPFVSGCNKDLRFRFDYMNQTSNKMFRKTL
jgi:hypothetical protein